MSSPFEEIVELKVRYNDAIVRRAAHQIENLQTKARGIPLSVEVQQRSFLRAAAVLDAATKLRTAVVKIDVDDRSLNSSIASVKNKLSNTKFTAQLDKSAFENRLGELELKRAALANKFAEGFKTKIDADSALLSMRKLQHEADTLGDKLNRINDEKLTIGADNGPITMLGNGIKSAILSVGSLRSLVSKLPPGVLAGAAAFGTLAVGAAATGAAVGATVVGVGALTAAALSGSERFKQAWGNAGAFIKSDFTNTAKQLEPIHVSIANKVRDTYREVSPTIRNIVKNSGPQLESLADSLLNGFRKVMPSVDNLISKSKPIADGLGKAFESIADGVSNMLDSMASSSTGAGQGLELLGKLAGGVITTFGILVEIANDTVEALSLVGKVAEEALGLLSGPAGKAAAKGFLKDFGDQLNPEGLFRAFKNLASPLIIDMGEPTVLVNGKRVPAGSLKTEDIVPPPAPLKTPFLPDLAGKVQGELDHVSRIVGDAVRYAELSNLGGRFKAAMDMTPAQQAVTHVTSLRNAWMQSAAGVADVEKRMAQASVQNAQAVADAARGIASAESAVRDAQSGVRTAQLELNQARKDAAIDILNMKSALRDLGDNEEAALIRLERAKLAAQEAALAKDQEFTQDQLNHRANVEADLRRRETLLEVKNAEENLHDTRAAGKQTREEIAEAERKGIENHPLVLAAKAQLTGAINTEKGAQDRLIEANANLVSVQADNAARMADLTAQLIDQRKKTDESQAAYAALLSMLGLTDAQVLLYAKHLKELPDAVDQYIKLHGLEDVLKGSARLSLEIDAQRLMAENPGMTPEQALNQAGARHVQRKIDNDLFNKLQSGNHGLQSRKDGGPISGPGDSRSDSVPIMAARGEFMQPTDAVQHYGTGFMEAVRRKKLPKFADGGGIGYDWNVDMKRWAVPDMMRRSDIVARARANAEAFYAPQLSGGMGLGSSSDSAVAAIHQVAKKFDPGAILTSGYRAGDPGNHGKGLAADFGGNMGAIARGFYGIKESLLQLIHSGSGGYFAAGGKAVSGPGYYGHAEVNNHYDHVHVAARKDAMEAVLGGGGGVSGGAGVERWRGVVNQALGIVGQPVSLANTTLRRMNQESGGDPNVVNKWDSNWHAGYPSVGLMQVIRGTYAANKHPAHDVGPYSYGVSTNPLANILASMRYTLGRYGSLPAGYNRSGGYKDGGLVFDEGGVLPVGSSIVNNKTGSPEPLLNAAKEINLSDTTILHMARILAQVLSNRPAQVTLPDGRVLAETVSSAMLGEATLPGVSF